MSAIKEVKADISHIENYTTSIHARVYVGNAKVAVISHIEKFESFTITRSKKHKICSYV